MAHAKNKPAVLQTGPKTILGKQRSSKNAQQYGIFTKSYLASENHDQLDQQYLGLCEQWDAMDPTRQILVRGLHQAAISADRLALAQQQMIDAAMQSSNIRKQFAHLAGLSPLTCESFPEWFFQEPNHAEKQWAVYIDRVWYQAYELKAGYSDRLVAEVAEHFPQLFHFVMQKEKVGASFISVMGQRFRQNQPSLNLAALMNELKEQYPHHLVWAKDPKRYEIFIQGIRAQQIYEGMDCEKTLRYATAFQNQIMKACLALEALDRVEGKGAGSVMIGMDNPVIPIELAIKADDLVEGEG